MKPQPNRKFKYLSQPIHPIHKDILDKAYEIRELLVSAGLHSVEICPDKVKLNILYTDETVSFS